MIAFSTCILMVWVIAGAEAFCVSTTKRCKTAPLPRRELCCRFQLDATKRGDSNDDDQLDRNPRKDDLEETVDEIEGIPIVPLAVASVLFVSFWPLLALFRVQASSPIDGFDIDMFMALKGILSENESASIDNPTSILELPPLSPAEQLVGAIFGPPR